jgi:integrase
MSYRVRFGKQKFRELIGQSDDASERDRFRLMSTPALFDGVRIQRPPTLFIAALSTGGCYFNEQAKFEVNGSQIARQKTLAQYGNELKLFLEWIRQRELDEKTIEFEELKKFAFDMADGWPVGNSLKLETIKSRFSIAAKYLSFLFASAIRGPFKPELSLKTFRQGTGRRKSVTRKSVRYEVVCPAIFSIQKDVQKAKTAPCLDSDKDALKICSEASQRPGPVGLMYETVFRTGLRSSEVVGIRISDLDNAWSLRQSTMVMEVEVGTKGQLNGISNDGLGMSKRRQIWVPVDLYERLQRYRNGLRKNTRKIQLGSGSVRYGHKRVNPKEPEALFLSTQTGMPFEEKTIQNYFKLDANKAGFSGFGIHKGRSHYGCHFLLDKACSMSGIKFKDEDGNLRPPAISDLNVLPQGQQIELLRTLSSPVTREMLREFLGHENYQTTAGYIRYLESILISIQSEIRNTTWAQ